MSSYEVRRPVVDRGSGGDFYPGRVAVTRFILEMGYELTVSTWTRQVNTFGTCAYLLT